MSFVCDAFLSLMLQFEETTIKNAQVCLLFCVDFQMIWTLLNLNGFITQPFVASVGKNIRDRKNTELDNFSCAPIDIFKIV